MARTRTTRPRTADDYEEPGSDGYEADDAPPPPRPSGRRTATSGRRSRTSGPVEPPVDEGRGFLPRLVAGMLGAVIPAGAAAGATWPEVQAAWHAILADVTFPTWQAYGVVVALVLGAALVLGIIAALHDRSLWKCLLIGAAWGALAQVGVGWYAATMPDPAAPQDNVAAGAVMTTAALAPATAGTRPLEAQRASEQAEADAALGERDQRIATLETERDDLTTELETARAAVTAAEAAKSELATRQSELQQQVDRTKAELAAATGSITELEAERDRLAGQVETLRADLDTAKALADEATAAKDRLEQELANARTQVAAAKRALEQARADAAALKSLQGE